MSNLMPVFVVLLILAVAFAAYQWRRITELEGGLKRLEDGKEEKRAEAEAARREASKQREELEKVKNELHEAKVKLKRQHKEQVDEPEGKKKKDTQENARAKPESAAAVVHISNRELEETHSRAMDTVRAELATARAEIETLKKKAAAAVAAASSSPAAPAPMPPPVAAAPAPPPVLHASKAGDDVESLKTQIEAMQRAANERESTLRRDLSKAQAELRSAERRASNNHQLYQAAKNQMLMVEDKLAKLRQRYEGAVSPEELKARKKADEPAAPSAEAAQAAPSAEAAQAAPSADAAPAPQADAGATLQGESPAAAEAAAQTDAPAEPAPVEAAAEPLPPAAPADATRNAS